MSEISIRKAGIEDARLILDLIIELAVYEKAADEVKTDEEGIRNSLFSPGATAHALICSIEGQPVGYAVYFYNYSTWLGKNGLYLEDVYVTPQYRGRGAGKALLKYLARDAMARGCGRFEWSVLDWNQPAIEFYQSLGARPQEGWTVYRLSGEQLEQLARD